jgi:ABC-2 type transport system permease protein
MNSHSNANAMPGSPLPGLQVRGAELDTPVRPPAVASETRPLYWSVRRELWENRSIYLAPLAAGAVALFGFLISLTWLPRTAHAMAALDPTHEPSVLARPYDFVAGLLMATALIVGVFYCLDALLGERRDRSILFWKSMPVSDVTTVLSKASIPLVVLPLLAFTITVAAQVIMLLLSSAVLLGHGMSVATYWTQLSLFQMSAGLFYHLLTVHVLLHAPFYCWFLLVSAWARRAAFLWAFLPPLAICAVEKIAFNTTYFAFMLGHQLSGGSEAIPFPGRMPMDAGMQLTPGHFLLSPGLWIGLACAAGFLAAAVRLRRYREPI